MNIRLGNCLSTLSLLLFSTSAFAIGARPDMYRLFPVLQCPAVGDEYEKMIAKLETIKASVKDKANCSPVLQQVDNLETLLNSDRTKVIGIVDKSGSQPLSADDANAVRDYAEGLTKKVSSLSDLFLNSNHCFAEDNVDKQLSSLAGFVNEASQLVGAVTGPWGAPIVLAGNVLAGFMTGLDQVLKSRAGFDYSKREQWLSYVQNLCTYHSYRDQIDHLLNPKAKITQLNALKYKLEGQLKIMLRDCEECRQISTAYNANKDGTLTVSATINEAEAVADRKFAKPYGSYTLQSLGLIDWITREIQRVEKDAESDWGNASGQYLLSRAKDELEDFLLTREAPRFLSFQVQQSAHDYSNFQSFVGAEGPTIYSQVTRLNHAAIARPIREAMWMDPLEYFRTLVLSTIAWDKLPASDTAEDLKYAWTHFHDQSLLELRAAQTSARVALSFCSFFRHSGQYGPTIRSQCNSDQLKQLTSAQAQLEKELSAVDPAAADLVKPNALGQMPEDGAPFSLNPLDALTKTIQQRQIEN